MAEPLESSFGPDVPARIAAMVEQVDSSFATEAFLADALDGYEELELTPRARQIARALGKHLPADYEEAIGVLVASLGPKLESSELTGMEVFVSLPHVFYVAELGGEHFEASMRAQYELTQRFSAEYSIRVFLERYPERTLARLREWALDPSGHVRRLVSEGTLASRREAPNAAGSSATRSARRSSKAIRRRSGASATAERRAALSAACGSRPGSSS